MEQRVSLITLGVGDLMAAARFYESGLGWKRANSEPGIVFFQLPGMVLGLWSRKDLAEEAGVEDSGAGFSGMALAYNARSREEVDRVLDEAAAAGATLLKRAREVFWGGYLGYFRDPDGHVWEVAHNPFWTIAEDGSLRMDSGSGA
ncbi:MAG: VOC family protein [Tepidamorphaceae bacterium]